MNYSHLMRAIAKLAELYDCEGHCEQELKLLIAHAEQLGLTGSPEELICQGALTEDEIWELDNARRLLGIFIR